MTALLAAATLAYGFAPGKPLDYRLEVDLVGFIPILGGQEGAVKVDMRMRVEGLAPGGDGLKRATSEILDAKLLFNDAPLPLGVGAVREYFPKTTVRFTSLGEIKSTDAPDVRLPVRLPGLDVQRFPDISYLPVVFPPDPMEVGREWTFRKLFGDSEVTFVCTLRKREAGQSTLGIRLSQTYETLEDEGLQVVANEADAVSRVRTEVRGEGEAVFDESLGAFRSSIITATATGTVTNLKTRETSERKLVTTVRLTLVEPAGALGRMEESIR